MSIPPRTVLDWRVDRDRPENGWHSVASRVSVASMQFLKILFWCLLAFVAALFTYGNWNNVQIHLWAGLVAEVNLPLLLAVTFLIGFLPTLLFHHAVRWRLRSRLSNVERAIAELRTPEPAPAAEPMIAPGTPDPLPAPPPGALL